MGIILKISKKCGIYERNNKLNLTVIQMEITGIIISGMGKGTYFMSQDFYIRQFQDKIRLTPFGGTLNIKIDSNAIKNIMNIPENKFGIIQGEGKFGDVKYIKAILNDDVNGALVFPAKTEHTEDVLEFISDKNLRKHFKLEDGDEIHLKIG
jgi:riboflavin kinase, archaea type